MALELYFHPFASFCQKVLVALYENETAFEPHLVDLGDARSLAAFKRLWPIGKMPVLRDGADGPIVPETSIIIEYLALHYPGRTALLPADPDRAWQTRLWDRFFDLYVADPMSKIVTDNLRPEGQHDTFGVEEARKQLTTAYRVADGWLAGRDWAVGDTFTLADCAAAPALFYANLVQPFGEFPHVAAYFARLERRPSYATVRAEAEPYMKLFPASAGER